MKVLDENNIVNVLKNLKDDNDSNKPYIKGDWFDEYEFTPDIIECINNCTSPRASKKNKQIPEDDLKLIFKAFSLFEPSETRVLILGQDPYPEVERAHGLAFSFKKNQEPDDSLLNIFKAIKVYKGDMKRYFCDIAKKEVKWSTNLEIWAKKKGILLLNTALTHENKDTIKNHRVKWEIFIQQVIKNLISSKLNNKNSKLAVFLWGKDAQETFLKSLCNDKNLHEFLSIFNGKHGIKKINNKFEFRENSFRLINEKNKITMNENIKIYMTSHPSNKSVKLGFCCNTPRHFKACDEFLEEHIFKDFPENNTEDYYKNKK